MLPLMWLFRIAVNLPGHKEIDENRVKLKNAILNPEFLNLIGDTTSHARLDTDVSLSMETYR